MKQRLGSSSSIYIVYAITFLKNFLPGGPQVPSYISRVTFMNSGAADQERTRQGQKKSSPQKIKEFFFVEILPPDIFKNNSLLLTQNIPATQACNPIQKMFQKAKMITLVKYDIFKTFQENICHHDMLINFSQLFNYYFKYQYYKSKGIEPE